MSGCVDVRDFAKAVSNYGVHAEVFEDLIQQHCQSPSEMTFSEFDTAFRKRLLYVLFDTVLAKCFRQGWGWG